MFSPNISISSHISSRDAGAANQAVRVEGALPHPRHSADHGGPTGRALGGAGPVAAFASDGEQMERI